MPAPGPTRGMSSSVRISVVCGVAMSRFCFIKLSLLLIAIETHNDEGTESNISINPGPELKLDSNSQGFFIAESADDVKRYLTTRACILHGGPKSRPFLKAYNTYVLTSVCNKVCKCCMIMPWSCMHMMTFKEGVPCIKNGQQNTYYTLWSRTDQVSDSKVKVDFAQISVRFRSLIDLVCPVGIVCYWLTRPSLRSASSGKYVTPRLPTNQVRRTRLLACWTGCLELTAT